MICICDFRTPRGVLDSLKKEFEVIQLPPDTSLPAPVCGHSDLLVFRLEKYLITRKSYYGIAKSEIDRICKQAKLELILSDAEAGDEYPLDCGLCAAVSGKNILCREASTDKEILSLAYRLSYKIIDVPQGYAKCSCALLADGSVITADRGIAAKALENDIDTLLIEAGNISLPGYDYGFIGGSSGLCGNKLYFCGDIKTHPDHEAIENFAQKHGTECVSLGSDMLYDVGTLIFI